MKAILIDPYSETITETQINDWREIAPALDCDLFTTVTLSFKNGFPEETLYVDDCGLITGEIQDKKFIRLEGYGAPLAGKALILSTNEEGESRGTKMEVEEVKSKVKFMDYFQVAFAIKLGNF